jgi:ABC-type multidrug transport system fused ATPase/permease subunit
VTKAPGVLEILRRVGAVLSPRQRRKALGLLVLTFVETLFDVLGLATIPPLVYLVSDLSAIERKPALAFAKSVSGIRDPHQFVLALVGLVFVTFVIRHAFGLWVHHRQHLFAYEVALSLCRRQFDAHLGLPYEKVKRVPSAIATRDIAMIPSEFGTNVLLPVGVILTEGLVVAWILIGILLVDGRVMALMSLVVLPPVLITHRLIRGRVQRLGNERLASRSEGYRVLAQGLFGFVYVKLSDAAQYFVDRTLRSFADLYRAETGLALLGYLPRQLIELSAVAGIGALIAYAMISGQRDAELITVLALLVAAAYRVMPSMTRLLTAFTKVKSSAHVFGLLPARGEDVIPARRESGTRAEFRHELAFKAVSFAYEGGDGFAVRDVHFRVRRGERVGFVGPSGSGKTTIMNIVLRLIREMNGEVLVDGRPLTPADDWGWQSILGYVQQDPYLLDGTLAENVAFGEPPERIDRARVDSSLVAASLGGFVRSLPRGIDSLLGEFGGTLSGGQRQRIAIARALYRRAEILVLDEATSALDLETEREVIETLLALGADRTKTFLIIAHHGAMLGICDRVYQFSEGRMVGELEGEPLRRWSAAHAQDVRAS